MVETLSVKNGFLTMVYGGGSTKLPSCKKSLGAHIQFVCDNVPEGQGVSGLRLHIVNSCP